MIGRMVTLSHKSEKLLGERASLQSQKFLNIQTKSLILH